MSLVVGLLDDIHSESVWYGRVNVFGNENLGGISVSRIFVSA